MQTTVFCKTTAKAKQSYFVKVDGKDYFLFNKILEKVIKSFSKKALM